MDTDEKGNFSVRVITMLKSSSRAGSNTCCQSLYLSCSVVQHSNLPISQQGRIKEGGKKSNKLTSIFHFFSINFKNSKNKTHILSEIQSSREIKLRGCKFNCLVFGRNKCHFSQNDQDSQNKNNPHTHFQGHMLLCFQKQRQGRGSTSNYDNSY